MYLISGNLAKIDGKSGKYDGKVKNDSVRYGRNALDNYKSYLSDISTSKMPPLQFEYRYMPDGKVNKLALLGNAYEELGKKTKVETEELTEKFKKNGCSDLSAEAVDINKDGYVDVGEYATTTIAQDILSSTDGYNIDPSKADGVINNDGETKALVLNNKKVVTEARGVFSKLYQDFGLEQAQKEFFADKNNLAE